MTKKVFIIGAGVAGLASSIRLRLQNREVTVIEKNPFPGGKLSDFKLGDYHFDRGPSLFTQPDNIRELFELAGRKLEDFLSIERLDEANRYFYEDGEVVKAYTVPEKFDEEVHQVLGEKKGSVINYLRNAEELYKSTGLIFLDYPLHKFSTWLHSRIIKALRVVKWKHLSSSVAVINAASFKNPKTVQLFNRFATYNGSNPFVAPGMLTMIPHLEHNEGAFYPKGGMIEITNALFKLAVELGVKFCFNETVIQIDKSDNRVSGVTTNKAQYKADIVVSNMDVYFTYQRLLKDKVQVSNILKQERSTSAVIFYFGINRVFEQLSLHNIFFSTDYEKEFKQLFVDKALPDDPTIYINITSKKDSTHAPVGHENWFIMVNAPAIEKLDWKEEVILLKKRVLEKLSRILKADIAAHVVQEVCWDPSGIQRDTSSYLGSLYGSSSNDRMAAFFRHNNESKKYSNLFFCGGTVHPGGGIPLCLKSARLVDKLVLEQFPL